MFGLRSLGIQTSGKKGSSSSHQDRDAETLCVESTEAVASDADGSVTNSSQLRLVRSIRLARALRGVRVVRLFRYVSALRTGGGKDRDRI